MTHFRPGTKIERLARKISYQNSEIREEKMYIEVQKLINASKDQVWKAISDIENATNIFKDIKSIEVLEKPQSGLLRLKWKEVRVFMGKEAAETMWITEVEEFKSYTAEAQNSGCLYHSSISIHENDYGLVVSKSFKSTPQTILAKFMSPIMHLMKGTLKKCLAKDLEDLNSYFERVS